MVFTAICFLFAELKQYGCDSSVFENDDERSVSLPGCPAMCFSAVMGVGASILGVWLAGYVKRGWPVFVSATPLKGGRDASF